MPIFRQIHKHIQNY